MSTIAIIPARGGSKGIPRKNMRLMNGVPLIEHAIRHALDCQEIDTVVVSTDSKEIASFAKQFDGVIALDRDSKLAQDAVTLDPVIYDAVVRVEAKLGRKYDTVVTLQATSPLLRAETLTKGIRYFKESGKDSVISVTNAPHLSWTKSDSGEVVPAYKARLNRQQLPPNYLETGAFFVSQRSVVFPDSRLGTTVGVFEVPSDEAIDIDSWQDWVLCETSFNRKKIVFRVDGYAELGLGHIYRCLTLAYECTEHDVVFITLAQYKEGVERLRSANMHVVELNSEDELIPWLTANKTDIFVNDCLDTTLSYVQSIKQHVGRFISFEDLGEGIREADAVINAIYEGASPLPNVYTGKKYVCLRDEFLTARPKSFSEQVQQVLVMFGGTDPLNLSQRVYDVAWDYNAKGVKVHFDFVLGSGYSHPKPESSPELGINVVQDVARVTDHMKQADLAFSSQGRTTFELATMGVPTIILAQNTREQLHPFAQMDNGFINLGLGSDVSNADISSTLDWLVKSASIRKEMHTLMLHNDLKSGIKRVKRIILGEMD
ncbi:MAG: acylneuraminate cytidylyltransferase [Eggerthellaceae bacterium]